jgi:hypothetical protein
MPSIQVTVNEEDRRRLKSLFGEAADLDGLIDKIARAGADELVAQATGRAVFSTISELRLYRVYRLLASGMSLKDAELLVPSLFKVTPASARRLIETAVARYEVELKDGVVLRVVELLNAADWEEDRWDVQLPTGIVQRAVLDKVERLNTANPDRGGRGQIWRFPDETYQGVREAYGLRRRPKPKS